MSETNEATALALLAQIGTGALRMDGFAPDARWWWNGGLDVPVAEFAAILARLHAQTTDGIHIVPGLVMTKGDRVMVEATTVSPLKDGRTYDNRYVFLVEIRDGLIHGVREYSDSAHVLATFDLGE